MWKRIGQVFVAELYAFGALVTGGLSALGASMTLSGASRHDPSVSWSLVFAFAGVAVLFARGAFTRARRALSRAG